MKQFCLVLTLIYSVFSHAQTYQWAKVIGAPLGGSGGNPPNAGFCVTTDASGNIYTTGIFQGTNTDFNPGMSPVNLSSGNINIGDIFFAKYSASGNCIWAKGITSSAGTGRQITVDAANNIYITGHFQGTNVDFDPGPANLLLSSSGVNDIFFVKYDNNGNLIWAKSIGGSNQDFGKSINVDPSGNVYISGEFQSANVDFDPGSGVSMLSAIPSSLLVFDIFLAKYDANGNYLWAKAIGNTGDDLSYSGSIDALGNLYITGLFKGNNVDFDPGSGTAFLSAGASTNAAVFFAKYDTNGNYTWAHTVSGSSPSCGYAIKVDGTGNAWLSGGFTGSNLDFDPGPGTVILNAPNTDCFFAKYDLNGNCIWANSIVGAIPHNLAIGSAGHLYLTGQINSSFGAADFDPGPGSATIAIPSPGNDVFFAKYDEGGNYIWAKTIVGPGTTDFGRSIAVDNNANVFLTGHVSGNNIDFNPGPGTTSISTSGYSYNYLAKYSYCSQQVNNSHFICAEQSYTVGGSTYTASGLYTDTLYSAFGCDSIVVTQLTVGAQQPTVAINSAVALCSGSANTLTASGAVSYTWSTGAQANVITLIPTLTIPVTVAGTGTSGCTASATINVLPIPSFSVIGKSTICKGEKIILTGTGANSYTWNSGAQTPSIAATLSTTTVFSVTASFTDSPCNSMQTVTININPCLGFTTNNRVTYQLSIFPNPSTTEIFYTVNSYVNHRYSITDFSGKVVAEGEERGNKVRLDVSNYKPGIYNLTVTIGRNSASKRFIIKVPD